MKATDMLHVTNRNDWRAWLKKNHATKKEVWLVYYKKHTGRPGITYDDGVEEALCFGWIDSIVKRLDDEKFARKFTPRRDGSNWSELNRKRARRMIRQGKMTETGLARFKEVDRKSLKTKTSKRRLVVPPDVKKALASNKKAWKKFGEFAPSYKKQYIGWITEAKRKETREKRIRQTVRRAAQNKKPGLM